MPLYEFLEKDVRERCRLLFGNVTLFVSWNFLTPVHVKARTRTLDESGVVTFIFLSNAIS